MSKKKSEPGVVNRTMFTQDNLYVMRGLESESFDLIYLDPPFNSKKQWNAPIGSKAAGAAFKDTWTLSDIDELEVDHMKRTYPKLAALINVVGTINGNADKSYLLMMAPRLVEMHRLLKPTGSLYLHCDPTMSHGLKLMLDAIFGSGKFRNEIIWSYSGWNKRLARKFESRHDLLYFYAKGRTIFFNGYNRPWASEGEYVAKRKQKVRKDEQGRKYVLSDAGNGKRVKRYLDDAMKYGAPVSSVWDIDKINNSSSERVGYPTQKPLALLDRIIKASCPDKGWVLDPFCGCATACVAAERIGRKWVGIDLSAKAAELVTMRFQNELGMWSETNELTHRTDLPKRTQDVVKTPKQELKKLLYGAQSGNCNGCGKHFEILHLALDHIIPRNRGGHDGDSNMQLLCGHCNSVKGDKSDAYLQSKLPKLDTYSEGT